VYDNPDLEVQDLAECESQDSNGADLSYYIFDVMGGIKSSDNGSWTFSYVDENDVKQTIAEDPAESGKYPLKVWLTSTDGDPASGVVITARLDNDGDTNASSNCYNEKTFTLTVYDNPDVTATPKTICLGESVDLSTLISADNGSLSYFTQSDYSDNNGAGLSSSIVTPQVTTTYYIKSVVQHTGFNCEGTTSVMITIENCAHLFPTQTTCCNYMDEANREEFDQDYLCVSTQGPNIKNVTPGVFFYYGDFQVSSTGENTITFIQERPQESGSAVNGSKFFSLVNTNNVWVYSGEDQSACENVTITGVTESNGVVTVTFNTPYTGAHILSLKFDSKSIQKGKYGGDNTYTFEIQGESGSFGQLPLDVDGQCDATPPDLGGYDGCTTGSNSFIQSTQSIQAESLSAEEPVVETDVAVYPVPFSDMINVDYEFDYSSDVTIEIFDFGGNLLRTVKDSNVSRGSTTSIAVDFSISANQMYLVRVATDRETFVKQIVSSKK
ncbi:T9SS type A sorting domain-containing protein, partial [Salinimicrobium sp. CAU 1759]